MLLTLHICHPRLACLDRSSTTLSTTGAMADVDLPVAVVLGSVGELQISGPGLAKGYLKIESQAFGSAPRTAGKRYSTGDAVRWAKEGLEFLGRLDSQAGLSR